MSDRYPTIRSLATWCSWSLVTAAAIACSAPAIDRDALAGERLESRDPDAALAAYDAFLQRCRPPDTVAARMRRQCAASFLARAELLDRTDRKERAAAAYLEAPRALPWDVSAAATGVYRAGRLYLELGQDRRGYQLLWATITGYPDEGFARDALQLVVRDGQRRDARQLYRELGRLLQALARTGIADNLLYAMATLAEERFDDPEAALANYDKLAADYPKSGMRDDALWHGARLARQLGDGRGAVDRLRLLLATREVAFGTGSYFSVWLDNGQLELGRVLRDDLREYRAALEAFATLPRHYPASVLIDDALFDSALTWHALGDVERVCQTLARLAADWPDSRYQLHQAPALRDQVGCSPSSDSR